MEDIFGYLLEQFQVLPAGLGLHEEPAHIRRFLKGHINRTYFVRVPAGDYVLQALNTAVYTDPAAVMTNIAQIERIFAAPQKLVQGEPRISVPHFLSASGQNYVLADGACWRMYQYVEGAAGQVSGTARIAGFAYGRFIRKLQEADLSLRQTVPGYHDFQTYYDQLTAVMGSGSYGTLSAVCDKLQRIFTTDMPRRLIHGDAKTDNLILQADDACTILDLDTVCHHYVALDYGDLVRSATAGISGTELLATIGEVPTGFAQGLDGLLTTAEIHSLFYGILWVTWELAVRYLTDCYAEERYFVNKTREDCQKRVTQLIEQAEQFTAIKEEIKQLIQEAFT
ncbi:MAG: aminoglycoside phosphotransferase family protein [Lachnospiraceae bacterium]|nr:aminoglycoside phosphotransferase family protein [Lachnospiraceae bacterium]